jgi:hypothetical protein
MLRFDLAQQALPDARDVGEGLRNLFRFSFDRDQRPYIGDVGQALEEIDAERADSPGGLNSRLGRRGGTSCFDPRPRRPACDDSSLVSPIREYGHLDEGDGG